jgi:hypothetical protein
MYEGESHRDLVKFFLVLTPNTLVVAVILAWPITAFEVRKNRIPWQHWAVLILTTLLLPQLKAMWISWQPLVRYLPAPFFHLPVSSFWPVNTFFLLLPAMVACAAILAHRRLSSYVLLTGGAVYILLVAVIIIFLNGGAMA